MEVIIELGSETKNINPFIEPLGEARRGKWRHSSLPLANLADANVAALPNLPGYHVAVDTLKRTIRVFDPLQKPADRKPVEAALRRFFKRRFEVEDEQKTDGHSPATLDRWLRWMHRLVENRNAAVVGGAIPPEIKQQVAEERGGDVRQTELSEEVET